MISYSLDRLAVFLCSIVFSSLPQMPGRNCHGLAKTTTCFGKIEPASPSGFSGITDLSLLQNIVIFQQNAANNHGIIACHD